MNETSISDLFLNLSYDKVVIKLYCDLIYHYLYDLSYYFNYSYCLITYMPHNVIDVQLHCIFVRADMIYSVKYSIISEINITVIIHKNML